MRQSGLRRLAIDRSFPSGRVLLIEPDESVRDAVATSLRSRGWQVEATGTASLLDPVADPPSGAGPPSIVVSESRLPDRTADWVLDRCRSRGLPVIFTGSETSTQSAVDLVRGGAEDFLAKPFPMARLLDLLYRLRKRQNGNVTPRVAEYDT